MRVSAINYSYTKPVLKNSGSKNLKSNETKTTDLQQDAVNFKGIKNAVKGAGILGIAGAIVGAICSGGTSILPTIAYFADCNAGIGAALGSQVDDNDD